MLQIDLAGRVVLVTGGTRGVGRGVSEAFLDAGATVVTCSRSDVPEADLPATGTARVAAHHTCDVRDPDAVAAIARLLADEHEARALEPFAEHGLGGRAPGWHPRQPAAASRSAASVRFSGRKGVASLSSDTPRIYPPTPCPDRCSS